MYRSPSVIRTTWVEGWSGYLGIRTTEGKLRGVGNTHKSSLDVEVKFLKAKTLYLTVHNNNNNNNNNNNTMYCNNNFNEKYWAVIRPKLSRPPGDPDYRGTTLLIFSIIFHKHILRYTQQAMIWIPGNKYPAGTKTFLFATTSGLALQPTLLCVPLPRSVLGVERIRRKADHWLSTATEVSTRLAIIWYSA
jgi:hypothetical protein